MNGTTQCVCSRILHNGVRIGFIVLFDDVPRLFMESVKYWNWNDFSAKLPITVIFYIVSKYLIIDVLWRENYSFVILVLLFWEIIYVLL